ncbi:MAG: ATP-binding protein [Gammaproteobacteria bacterium]
MPGPQTSLGRLRWQPLSLVGVLGQTNYAGFVIAVIWFAIIAVCVWWGIVGASLGWDIWRFSLFGTQVVLGFYLPWTICLLLMMWLGLEWAVIPAYLATLFNTLHSGVPVAIAVVNALHYPLALTVFFLFFCAISDSHELRTRRSWGVFIAASFIAAIVSSIGAFISQFYISANNAELLTTWFEWWTSNFIQSLISVAPLIFFLSPVVEGIKRRYFPNAHLEQFTQQKLLQLASMFVLTLVLLVLADSHWQNVHTSAIIAAPLPDNLRMQVQAQFNLQQFVIWVLALVLAAVSLGGVIAANLWIRRLRIAADSQTHAAKEALQHSETRFRNFFENNPAPMWVYDPAGGQFLETNQAATRCYGYSREEFLSMTIFDIRPPEEAGRLKEQMRSTDFTESLHHRGEWLHRRKDGGFMDVEMHVSSMIMDGRIVNLALVHDISPRKLMQATMEQRARELRILAAASLEIAGAQTAGQVLQIGVDRTRELLRSNLAVMHSWKQSNQDGIGWRVSLAPRFAQWAEFREPPDGSGIYKLVQQHPQPLRLTRDELQRHPQFRNFGVHKMEHPPLNGLLVVPLMHEGSATGALMVSDRMEGEFDAQDEALLTQLARIASVGLENLRLNSALRQHMHELEQRVAERTAELDAFAYSVAHDLRAPLRAMHGFAEAVLEDYGPGLDEAGRDYLARIVTASQNMDALIQDLLAYSHISRSHMVLEGVRLDKVMLEVLEELAREIELRQAVIRTEVPAMTVQAHPGMLKQVILNLVSNAIKFVAPGKQPEVVITAEGYDGRVILSVSDNGIGIPPEHRERIFNVFERLHGTESYQGTGIGLSIVKKGLARMQGEVSVESGSTGSTFRVNLKEFRPE